MFQTEHVTELRDVCRQHHIAIACYWVLMKGLLAGKLPRDHQFHPADRRLSYAIFQGQAWERSQDLLDQLRGLATDLGCTVSQLVIAWTLAQPDISVALVGAKRPAQIQETAAAMELTLSPVVLRQIDQWLAD